MFEMRQRAERMAFDPLRFALCAMRYCGYHSPSDFLSASLP